MKVFIVKSSLFFLLLLSFTVVGSYDYGVGIVSDKSDYMGAIVEKHKRLNGIKGNRIIFSGGSNLAFGLDTKRIQDSIKIPMVNLGLHAGLGLDFILKQLRYNIREGDIVVLSLEYFIQIEGSHDLIRNTVSFFPEAKLYAEIPSRSVFENLKNYLEKRIEKVKENKNFVTGLFKKETENPEFAYKRSLFNAFGDCIGHLDLIPSPYLNDRGDVSKENWVGIEHLNEFYKFAKSKNVKVCFMYPCFPRSEYLFNQEVINLMDADFHKDLLLPVLGKPEDFVFDDSLFYDTVYHLNKEGREKRTEKVIELLKSYFAKGKAES